MPLDATIEWPAGDVRALWAQIDRAQKAVGKSLGGAIRMAANSVARSLGTSTRISDKHRKFHRVEGSTTSRGRQEYVAIRPYYAQRERHFYAWDDAQAKRSRHVRIGRRGLAKATWRSVASFAGAGGAAGTSSPRVKSLAAKHGKMERRFSGDDPFAKLTNSLYYAEAALQGGANDVSTAMSRAARAMEHTIDNQIARKFA